MSKMASKLNATKHGIFADILLAGAPWGESEDHYLTLLAGLRTAIRPVDPLEEIQVQKLAFLYLRLARVYKHDSVIASKLFERVSEELEEDHSNVETHWVNEEDKAIVVKKEVGPDSFVRYENNVERQISRAYDQLEALRRLRVIELAPARGDH